MCSIITLCPKENIVDHPLVLLTLVGKWATDCFSAQACHEPRAAPAPTFNIQPGEEKEPFEQQKQDEEQEQLEEKENFHGADLHKTISG